MKFTEDEQSKIDKLPVILKYAVESLVGVIKRIIDGDCDADSVTDAMATLDNNAKGRYSDEDLVTYDKAAKILGISVTNRAKLKLLLDMNNIQQVTLHNHKVGFLRSELMALRSKLYDDPKKRHKKFW